MFSYRPDSTAISFPIRFTSSVIFLTLLLFAKICTPFELLIGTGDVDSFSNFAGKSICRSLERYADNVTCQLAPQKEATDLLTNLQSDSIDLALVSSKTIYDALHGVGSFQYININYNDLRLLRPIYRSPITLIARRDARISKVDDLIKKRVNGGVHSTDENQVFQQLMTLKNWEKNDFPLYQNLPHTFSQDFLALKRGSIQVMLHVGMHPADTLRTLLAQGQTTLIGLYDSDLEKLIQDKAGYTSCKIASGTYPAVSKEFTTLAMETLLIASAATDDDTVQLVLKALNESRRQLQYAHPALLRRKIKISTLNESYLHPHPSALLFFQSTPELY